MASFEIIFYRSFIEKVMVPVFRSENFSEIEYLEAIVFSI